MKNTKELNKQKIKIKEKHVGTTIGRPLLQRLDYRDGITLLALVITIVLMLILVSVTVNVAINGGLFEYAGNAKYDLEKASEKESIQKAVMIAKSSSKTGRVTVEDMQKAINKVTNGEKVEVINNEGKIAIEFNDSSIYYIVDGNGKIESTRKVVKVDNAGKMGTNKEYAETTEFVINCIEDLVAFSIMTNGGNENLNLESGDFANKNVKLARDLDFNSIFSYNDYSTKIYGDLNGDETTDELKTELTKQGDKCGGFTPIGTFKGTFDGQGNKICNLYENRGTSNAGLFLSSSGTIKNLGLENIALTGGSYIGGVAASLNVNSKTLNCYVEGTSTLKCTLTSGTRYCGLIAGSGNQTTIECCYSKGNLDIDLAYGFGGIIGSFSNRSNKKMLQYNGYYIKFIRCCGNS